MSDTLQVFGQTYTNVAGFKATDDNDDTQTYIKPEGTISITQNGTVDVTEYASALVNVSGGSSVATGTFTPASLTGSVTINTGLTTVHGLLIIPAESLDLSSSTYKLYTVWLEDPATYIKMFCARRNSSGRSFELWVSGTPPYSISGGTIDIVFSYPSNTGYFDTKAYKWYAW